MSLSQPAIVLVHGAWADASSWNSVLPELQQRGFTVYAPPNPLRGLPQDSASVHQFLTQNAALQGQPVVLVGHSYGGRSSPTPRSVPPGSGPWCTWTPSATRDCGPCNRAPARSSARPATAPRAPVR
jgi:Alpha/beta hydrolase family